MKEIKDYLHLYLGCQVQTLLEKGVQINLGLYYPDVWIEKGNFEANGVNVYYAESNRIWVKNFNQVKLLLRPLSDMTEEEKKELSDLAFVDSLLIKEDNYGEIRFYATPKRVLYLLSKHFDLFGLIEAGLAIDKTTLK